MRSRASALSEEATFSDQDTKVLLKGAQQKI